MVIAAPYLPITIRFKSVLKVMCKAKAFFVFYKISLLNCTDSITTLKSMPMLPEIVSIDLLIWILSTKYF